MRALLDINVLVALLDTAHAHHRVTTDWLAANLGHGWASCPLTQNGCLRVLAQPAYPSPLPLLQVVERLALATADESHVFWHDSVSLLDAGRVNWTQLLTGRQLTDAYLFALAVAQGGRFVTLDRGVATAAVQGAKRGHLVTLG